MFKIKQLIALASILILSAPLYSFGAPIVFDLSGNFETVDTVLVGGVWQTEIYQDDQSPPIPVGKGSQSHAFSGTLILDDQPLFERNEGRNAEFKILSYTVTVPTLIGAQVYEPSNEADGVWRVHPDSYIVLFGLDGCLCDKRADEVMSDWSKYNFSFSLHSSNYQNNVTSFDHYEDGIRTAFVGGNGTLTFREHIYAVPESNSLILLIICCIGLVSRSKKKHALID